MDGLKPDALLVDESLEMVDEAPNPLDSDELKQAVEDQMSKLRTQSMLLGAQSMCRVILDKIYTHLAKPGKKTYSDYERLVLDVKQFCETGLSRQVNTDGTTSPIEEENEESVNE